MSGVLIGAAIWLAVALMVAVVLGRVSRRADREELGSTLNWDSSELDEAVQHD
ncbi:hypothetical protein QMK17_19895 [Rhodococcus sp. G-MC3]|uniref:hypothetical protein n=1 Tax=Rhodococcus sp. G-MC3 TaxID=3046209 RepID=UPI0024BB5078|nr:hypothetical protein [Rhodococcus sp. G-MC3]MDJ0395587.1 hypothetical protein [Rhodococcus sp. G-MC3]